MSTGRRARGPATQAVAGEIRAERGRLRIDSKKVTQREIAEAAGIPVDTYKSIETGRGPIDIDQLFAIAGALGVKASDLAAEAERVMARNANVTAFPKASDLRPTVDDADLIDEPSAAEPERRDDRKGSE